MKPSHTIKMLALAASVAATLVPLQAGADDIDIFTGAGAGKNGNARILIVLDNQSHWTAQNQKWPGGIAQGQAELRAIKRLVNAIPDGSIDMGLMIFSSGSVGNTDGAYMRQRVATISSVKEGLAEKSTKEEFSAKLDSIFDNIGKPAEKRSSGARYGNLIYDAYNYWAGGVPTYKDEVPAALADPLAYVAPYSKYKSPITATNQCGKNYIIFIGNPASDGVQDDTPGGNDTMVPDNLRKEADERDKSGNLINPFPLPLPNITEDVKQTTVEQLGETKSCYATAALANAEIATRTDLTEACKTYTQGCSIGVQLPAGGLACPANNYQWAINGTDIYITNVIAAGTVVDNINSYLDDFALLMAGKGVKMADSTTTPPARVPVTTFTIDVYNAQSNSEHTQVLLSTANAGNGGYFKAGNEEEIYKALAQILAQIQATDTAFAATSLPVSATNRAQNANAVFIGMFRPDEKARPRWFGNLKRFKLITSNGEIALGDFNGKAAINNTNGFLKPCAVSYWTTDTPWTYKYGGLTLETGYWDQMGLSPTPKGNCPDEEIPGNRAYSDYPDGSFVEKGAAAEVLRLGNSTLVAGADWEKATLNRNMLTLSSGNAVVDFNAVNTSLESTLVDFIRGEDINYERTKGLVPAMKPTAPRPSIHGDVIHSRPLPVNYAAPGDSTEAVTIYYGANDGALHAVDATTGVEKWSFVAPEFFDKLTRLKTNGPLISYPNDKGEIDAGTLPRAYFFDGSTGVYQNADNSKIAIYPTMRRGGRMIYGLDVTDRASPKFLWRTGCPNLDNDLNCKEGKGDVVNADVKSIGQTWSTPNVAFIKGYSKDADKVPVLFVGGGYDNCQDKNTADPDCSAGKGGFVYAIDALSGMVVQTFKTDLGVVADIAYVDVNNDNKPDYAYALDLGGNVYRIDFAIGADAATSLAEGKWKFRKVAYTRGGGRKFMYAPALLSAKDKVYLAAGTGDREHPLEIQYPFKTVTNRFYVYLDDLALPDTSDPVDLDKMTNYTTGTDCDTPPVLPKSDLIGWYMDLAAGEQVVTSAVIVSGMVTFSTNRPTPAATGTCTNSLGEARGYWVNLFNASGAVNTTKSCGGDRSSKFVSGGLPPSPVLAPSVVVDGKPVSVIIGAAAKTAGGTDAGSAFAPRQIKLTISKERKRTYTYSKGE